MPSKVPRKHVNIDPIEKIGGKKITPSQGVEVKKLGELIEEFTNAMSDQRLSEIAWMRFHIEDLKGKSYTVRAWISSKKK